MTLWNTRSSGDVLSTLKNKSTIKAFLAGFPIDAFFRLSQTKSPNLILGLSKALEQIKGDASGNVDEEEETQTNVVTLLVAIFSGQARHCTDMESELALIDLNSEVEALLREKIVKLWTLEGISEFIMT